MKIRIIKNLDEKKKRKKRKKPKPRAAYWWGYGLHDNDYGDSGDSGGDGKRDDDLKETIKKVGDKWVVYPKKGGKRLGTHDTEEEAKAQLAAIEINKEQIELDEKKDACYHKVRSRYDVWPSAYASGALVKCRKVGAKNWGNSKKNESVEDKPKKKIKIKRSMEEAT